MVEPVMREWNIPSGRRGGAFSELIDLSGLVGLWGAEREESLSIRDPNVVFVRTGAERDGFAENVVLTRGVERPGRDLEAVIAEYEAVTRAIPGWAATLSARAGNAAHGVEIVVLTGTFNSDPVVREGVGGLDSSTILLVHGLPAQARPEQLVVTTFSDDTRWRDDLLRAVMIGGESAARILAEAGRYATPDH